MVRGVFLLRKQEIDWFYQRGASVLFPDAWEPYFAYIPESERDDMLAAYYRRLTSEDAEVRMAAAKIWSGWEGATSKLLPDAASAATTKRMSSRWHSRGSRHTTLPTRVFLRRTTSCCAMHRGFGISPG